MIAWSGASLEIGQQDGRVQVLRGLKINLNLIYHLITMVKVLPQLQITNSGETLCHQQLLVGLWSDRAASTEPGACYFSYPENQALKDDFGSRPR